MKDFAQSLLRLWSQLGLNQRVSLALAALALLGLLGGIAVWSGRPDYQLLYGRLGEKDATGIISQLQEQGIPYRVEQGGGAVYVPSDQIYRVRAALAKKGLPTGEGVGLEIFDRSNFGVSDFVQRTNYLRALQGELVRTITQMEGVRGARVLIVQPENRLLVLNNPAPPSASVFVDTAGLQLPVESVNAIRRLVANAVQGLEPNHVTVVDQKGRVLSEELDEDPALAGATAQMRHRRGVEDYLTRKVQTMLEAVVGAGNAVVRVSVDLDPEAVTRASEVYDPAGQVIRSQTSTEDASTSSEPRTGGVVGTAANVPGETGAEAAPGGETPRNEQNRKNRSTQYEINTTRTNVVKGAGTIRRLSAAVFLNQRPAAAPAAGAVAGPAGVPAAPTPRSAEEIDALRQLVMNALGLTVPEGESAESLVAIREIAFPEMVLPPEGSPVAVGTGLGTWLDLLRQWLPVGVGLAVLLVFLRLLRREKPEVIPVEVLTEYENSRHTPPPVVPITPELINSLIREKPDAVGASLREWVAETNAKE